MNNQAIAGSSWRNPYFLMAAFVAQALLLVAFCTAMTDKAMAAQETVIYGLPDPNGPREAARHPFHTRKEYWPAHNQMLGSGAPYPVYPGYVYGYPGYGGYPSDVRITGFNAPVRVYPGAPMYAEPRYVYGEPYYRMEGSDMYPEPYRRHRAVRHARHVEPRREYRAARYSEVSYDHINAAPAAMRWDSAYTYDFEPRVMNTVSWDWDKAVESYGAPGHVLDATLNRPVERATLDTIAYSIYREAHGSQYGTVSINWHLGANPEPGAPWARTVITR